MNTNLTIALLFIVIALIIFIFYKAGLLSNIQPSSNATPPVAPNANENEKSSLSQKEINAGYKPGDQIVVNYANIPDGYTSRFVEAVRLCYAENGLLKASLVERMGLPDVDAEIIYKLLIRENVLTTDGELIIPPANAEPPIERNSTMKKNEPLFDNTRYRDTTRTVLHKNSLPTIDNVYATREQLEREENLKKHHERLQMQDNFALIMDYIYPARMEISLKKAKQITGLDSDGILALMFDLIQRNILAASPEKAGYYVPMISEKDWYDLHYSFYEDESLH